MELPIKIFANELTTVRGDLVSSLLPIVPVEGFDNSVLEVNVHSMLRLFGARFTINVLSSRFIKA